LPSNLRPTTRECVHLVTRDHFRSRDEDDGHTIRSAIANYPMMHAHLLHVLLPIEVAHCRNEDRPFLLPDLDLDPMTFIHELDSNSAEMYRMSENEFPTSRLSKVIV